MDDDKDSFIVFIESETFDKNIKLKHDFYPYSGDGFSLLELCCYHGAVDCFKLLRTKFHSEITPVCLRFSFLSGKPDILSECLKYQKPDQDCMNFAIVSFNIYFVTFLNREYGLEIDLDYCCLCKNFQAFFIHLDITNDIENCFVMSINFSSTLLEYFISKGIDVNAKESKFQRTALQIAASVGNTTAVKLLISHGANINSTDIDGKTVLHYAASCYDKEMIEFLITHGANINSKTNLGYTPLHDAAEENNYELAKLLILHGTDINSKDNNGVTPLMKAAIYGCVEIAKLLLSHGALVNEKDNEGRTALFWTPANNSIDIAKLLILNGAFVNIRTNKEHTPLLFALVKNCFEIAELLLSNGAYINDKEMNGFNSLHLAVNLNDIDKEKFLIKHHININAKNNYGHSALYYAYLQKSEEMISFLELNGAT